MVFDTQMTSEIRDGGKPPSAFEVHHEEHYRPIEGMDSRERLDVHHGHVFVVRSCESRGPKKPYRIFPTRECAPISTISEPKLVIEPPRSTQLLQSGNPPDYAPHFSFLRQHGRILVPEFAARFSPPAPT